jgi:hypothetical protein
VWRWSGGETPAAEFGNPLDGEGYTACLFATGTSPTRLFAARVAPGGTCPPGGGRDCWRAAGSPLRFIYRDRAGSTAGLDRLVLRPGASGAAAVIVRGRETNLTPPALPLDPPVLFQLRTDSGPCWEATFDATAMRVNRPDLVKARTD